MPVSKSEPEDIVAVEHQGSHRGDQYHIAHIKLHLPSNIGAIKEDRRGDVPGSYLRNNIIWDQSSV